MNREDIAGLLARLEAATGPDASLGYEVHICVGAPRYDGTREAWYGHHEKWLNPILSTDAALALVERLLPGCDYSVNGGKHTVPSATLWPMSREVTADANTPPLAILIALLKALQSKDKP